MSRRTRDFLGALGIDFTTRPGLPDPCVLQQSTCLRFLRLAYQQWRLDQGCLKALPTFTTVAILQELGDVLDLLPDVYLSSEALACHLQERRLDLLVSSCLDLGGELIAEALDHPDSPFLAVPLFSDSVKLALNPAHPLAGASQANPEDCQPFSSPAYPSGIARRAADALKRRGLWRYACKRPSFEPAEWLLGMRSSTGLCYASGLLLESVPACRDLVLVPFANTLQQTTYAVMLKEVSSTPSMQRAVNAIRRSTRCALNRIPFEAALAS